MSEPAPSHQCEWKQVAEELQAQIARQQEELDALKRRLYGKKSEKLPRPADALRKRGDILPPDPDKLRKTREDGRKWKDNLPVIDMVQELPAELAACELCGDVPHHPLPPKVSYTIELVPARVVRHRNVQPQVRCDCGHCIACAPPPPRVGDKAQYGPRLASALIAAKCLDAVAIERYAKQLRRMDVPISPKTLNDLFHSAARQLARLYELLVAQVREHDLVAADETRIQVLAKVKTRRAWMWVFLCGDLIVYVFSTSRSGETPVMVLGASDGTLVVDAYTGYNPVTTPEGRDRSGCLAHARRGVFDAMPNAPEMQVGLDLILDVYKVEHQARELGIAGTAAHAELRRDQSKPAMDKLRAWLLEQQQVQLPESKAGKAVAYMLNQWPHLERFLTNPKIPVDNNASERALRVVARGRDAYLFVGNDEAGKNLAVLMTLTHTAAACGHNPEAYLADVLVRIHSHPVNRLHDLLPQNWSPPAPPPAATG